ncbi:unnamed protein product [Clonostachys rosea]|uniref:Cytochrome P450 n=1 Tax=Bionectria ochroleuca TaxID=29856 RepID=A0ABY6UVQ3_BIOOC|nr:unnamed protein product [Clonostachys rosea]
MQIILLLGLVGVAYAVYLIKSIWFTPLRNVPGPFLARFTNIWYLFQVHSGHVERKNCELHETYGPVVRYGPNRYSFNSPEAIKTIYGHSTQFAKSSFYDAFMVPGRWNVFTERNIKFHASLRREYQATFSMSNLVNFEPYVDQCAKLFDQRLHEVSEAGVAIDMGHWLQCYALDVISQITFAERLGTLDSGEDIGGVMKSLEDSFYYGSTVGVYGSIHPYLFAFVSFLDRLSGSGNGQGIGYVIKIAQEKINAYKAKPAAIYQETEDGSEEFVSKFMKQNAANPERFTTNHILNGCAMNIGAGSDTTGISLSAVLYYLLKNPGCMGKLREEIFAFRKEGRLSESPTYKQSQDMPYLQAVLKEALRLHPAVGQPLERVVPEGGATIDGKYFAQGNIVGVSCWAAHRNKAVWGQDADEFKPDRWLITDTDKLSAMNRSWMPFGVGSRTCLGRHISMLEMCKLVPRIIRDFDFELVDGLGAEWKTTAYWFVKPSNFRVRVRTRSTIS